MRSRARDQLDGTALKAPVTDGPDEDDGGGAGTPPRRRRRAVGPAGSTSAVPDVGPAAWSGEHEPSEDDDERLLREVPPHHGR